MWDSVERVPDMTAEGPFERKDKTPPRPPIWPPRRDYIERRDRDNRIERRDYEDSDEGLPGRDPDDAD